MKTTSLGYSLMNGIRKIDNDWSGLPDIETALDELERVVYHTSNEVYDRGLENNELAEALREASEAMNKVLRLIRELPEVE